MSLTSTNQMRQAIWPLGWLTDYGTATVTVRIADAAALYLHRSHRLRPNAQNCAPTFPVARMTNRREPTAEPPGCKASRP
jgi:hypothetical protein